MAQTGEKRRYKISHKLDNCHKPICKNLIACGCRIIDTSSAGDGIMDCIVNRGKIWALMEFKSQYGKLTPAQIRWRKNHPEWLDVLHTVRSVGEARRIMRIYIEDPLYKKTA
jgi:hypothetical protein